MNTTLYIAVIFSLLTGLNACTEQKQPTKKKPVELFTPQQIAAESKEANDFFARSFDARLDRDPEFQSYLGIKKDYGSWTDRSDEKAKMELEITKTALDSLKRKFTYEALNEQAKLSYRLFEYDAQQQIDNFKYRFHNYPINQMGGFHAELPAFLINIHQISDTSDAKAYISRLQKVDELFDQLLTGLKTREEKGIIPPKFVFPMVLEDCKNILTGQPFEKSTKKSTLLEDFTTKVNALKIPRAARQALIQEVDSALINHVKPAYEKLTAYLTALETKAPEEAGAWQFPHAEAFYRQALQYTTTTTLTAEQIHQTGLKEVARIHKEMRQIMQQVNFKSDSLQAFFTFMRTDKRFTYPNTAAGKKAYLRRATQIIDTMRNHLDELFLTKPEAPIEVKAVEAFREKSAGGAFYEVPALDGSRPGRYYVNLYTLNDQPIYQMESLAYHEGIPGHHMQLAIAQELENIPLFRKFSGNTAYIEGWALYAEFIPKEIGFYTDPYSDFGRLSNEVFRACRLVIDTGIHHKKWTRQQAIDYFIQNCPSPENDLRKEVERYIVWPSQATGYKIGMLKILELREMAKKQLRNNFDIREFHDVVLTNGAVPLHILEENVKNWIAKKQDI